MSPPASESTPASRGGDSTAPGAPEVIFNPSAGKTSTTRTIRTRLDAAQRAGARVWSPNDLRALDDVAAGIGVRKPPRVVVCGGDGTLMRVVSALTRYASTRLPPLVVCHTGTVGLVHKSLASRLAAHELLERSITAPDALSERSVSSLAVRVDDELLTTFSVGAGMVASFFREYEAAEYKGITRALAIAIRTFFGSFRSSPYAKRVLAPVPARLVIDSDYDVSGEYSLLICSVLRELGLGTKVTYRGGEDPERPHLVASQLAARRLGPQWPRVIAGKPLRGNDNVDRLVRHFSLEFPEPSPIVVDGDTFTARRVEVRAGPRLRFLVA